MTRLTTPAVQAAALALLLLVPAVTADEPAAPASGDPPPPEDVMRDLLLDRRPPPALPGEGDPAAAGLAPATQPAEQSRVIPAERAPSAASPLTAPIEMPAIPPTAATLDPAVIGRAPGAAALDLRREGEFIFSRRGQLVRSEKGQQMFSFAADTSETPETPMVLQPCRRLQDMEDIVGQRGDDVTFIISGQVHVYRGANYLLPTMMTIAIDRGNLEN